ncbi:MAG: hypothetical protein ACJ71I_15125 [Nitrososphaeraceae archaeon]
MSKFTKQQRQELKSIVANAMIRRLDVFETQRYIQDSLHVTISPDYVYHVKMQLKRDSVKELSLLAKDRDYYLKNMFFDRVHELEAQQQVLWDIVKDNKDRPEIQIKVIHELHALSVNLKNAYESLPGLAGLEVPIHYSDYDTHNQSNEPELDDSNAVF